MASDEGWAEARKTAVGMCALAAQDRKDDMKALLRMYLTSMAERGLPHNLSMMALVNALVSANLHVAKQIGDPVDVFSDLAETMAAI